MKESEEELNKSQIDSVLGLIQSFGANEETINNVSAALYGQLDSKTEQRATTDVLGGENDRIERYLSNFTHRIGILLTIAGLLSLFPLLNIQEWTSYFLKWIAPFLILGIVFYILSARRINIISKSSSLPRRDLTRINSILTGQFYRVLKFHKLADGALISFFVSFFISYYLFIFKEIPSITASILVLVIAILLGVFRFYYISSSREENGFHAVATGDTPDDMSI